MENRFDIYEMPQGHEARFEAKLDGRLSLQRSRRLVTRWTAAAACAALVAFLALERNSYFWRAHSPEAVYAAYLEQVGALHKQISASPDEDTAAQEALLHELTDENIALYDQLPDELSKRQKIKILKNHYGGLLSSAGELARKH